MPVGPYIVDFVSFPLRQVIDLVQASGTEEGADMRAAKHAWLAEHDYKIVEVRADEVEKDLAAVLEKLSSVITGPSRSDETR